MKTRLQIIQWKNWKTTQTMIMLGLVLSALVNAVPVAEAAPAKWVPSQAVSDYSDFVAVESPLIHDIPGTVANYTTIIWNLLGSQGGARVQLDNYVWGIYLHIGLQSNSKGEIVSVQVRGQGGPSGGPWPHHSTDWIPCTPVKLNLATGFIIHVHQDNIPVHVHSTAKSKSPRVGIAGHMALGDIVISPTP